MSAMTPMPKKEDHISVQCDNNLKDALVFQLGTSAARKSGIPLRAAGQITASNPTACSGETEKL